MKFSDLYNRVFVQEQDEAAPTETKNEIPVPENFDDVEPAPVAEPGAEVPAEEAPSGGTGSSLKNYVDQLEDFAKKLNGVEGESLQSLVSKLDVQATAFEGISSRTSHEIVDAAKTLLSISEKLKDFIIHSVKA